MQDLTQLSDQRGIGLLRSQSVTFTILVFFLCAKLKLLVVV